MRTISTIVFAMNRMCFGSKSDRKFQDSQSHWEKSQGKPLDPLSVARARQLLTSQRDYATRWCFRYCLEKSTKLAQPPKIRSQVWSRLCHLQKFTCRIISVSVTTFVNLVKQQRQYYALRSLSEPCLWSIFHSWHKNEKVISKPDSRRNDWEIFKQRRVVEPSPTEGAETTRSSVVFALSPCTRSHARFTKHFSKLISKYVSKMLFQVFIL